VSSASNRYWLAARYRDEAREGYWIVCRALGFWQPSGAALSAPLLEELTRMLLPPPRWLGYSVAIAGVPVVSSNSLESLILSTTGKNGGSDWVRTSWPMAPEILASAARLDHGVEMLRVNLHFLSPQMFYARQRTRGLLFSGLILVATAAALVGLFSARLAFLRQQQLSELKGNFVSSVSHELRAPIASVRLLAESLQRGTVTDPAKQGEYFGFIVQECRRLSSLIENVLNFARIDQGRKQYEFEPTDVLALLRQTFQLMEPTAGEKQLQLKLELPGEQLARLAALAPAPLLDGQAIQQALINLIDNALKHSPSGQTVTLGMGIPEPSSTEPPAPAPTLELFVADHGAGVPPEEHERIFERFYRRGSELRRETQGIGIGLSIVKHVAEAHGGRVQLQSEPGCGSRFTLLLPLRTALGP